MSALKVVSFNIQEGGDHRLESIASLIRAQDPDCVALLEADCVENAEALARDLHMTVTYGEANCPSAVAWLSRPPLPQERQSSHSRPGEDPAGDRSLLGRDSAPSF